MMFDRCFAHTTIRSGIWQLAIFACCTLVALGVALTWTLERTREADGQVVRTRLIRTELAAYTRELAAAETGQRGYLLTRQDEYLEPYRMALADNPQRLASLRTLVTDAASQPKLQRLSDLFDDKLKELAQTIQLTRAGDMQGALAIVLEGRGRRDTVDFDRIEREVSDTQAELLAMGQAVAERERTNVLAVVVIGSIFALVLIIAAARRTIAQIDGPLRALMGGIAALAQGDLHRRVETRSRDEIGKVALAFNEMADRLVEADRTREQAGRDQGRLAALVVSSTDAIMGKTLDGIVTSWNPAAEAMFGYTEQEMIGQPMALLIPPDRADEEAQILAKIRNGETIAHFETLRQRRGGALFPISVTISPIRDAADAIIGASKIARDISDQKAAEAELLRYRDHLERLVSVATAEVNAIVDTAVSGIITIDLLGIIRIFNPSAEKIFGWSKEEVVGKNVSILMDDDNSPKHDHYLAKFSETRQSRIIGTVREVRARRKDGSTFPANLSVGYAEPSKGESFFVGFVVDISDQKKNAAALLQAKEAAEASARAKAAFVANMSHEIRTPMNAILGFAEVLLRDASLPKESILHVQVILSSARALLGIINDVLDVSKLESGKFALEIVGFHLPNALAEALRLVDHQAAERGLKIVLEYDAELPLRVMGDPTRLRQVVLNLVGNAIKFSEKGAVILAVTPGNQADLLQFSVADQGIGMTPEQAERVFTPFTQADVSTTRRFGGTGLGAAISKQITELMGGEIWVESRYGVGSTFRFTAVLPAAADGTACLFEDVHPIIDEYVPPREFKVLLVEDIETNAMLAMYRMKQQGHQVDWRVNGLEAVAAFQADRYDLILMDVMMPEMDGLDASREIRRLERPGGRHTPIIALTASVMVEDHQKCIAAGMDDIQIKPIDFAKLFAVMEQIVPAGAGRPNTVLRIEIAASAKIDFSSLEGIVDIKAAIRTWRDPLIYAKALADFATGRSRDADEMERLLLGTPDDPEPARAVAHALKGLAGNLFVTRVADRATRVDSDLKAGRRKVVLSELGELRWLLAEAAIAIGKIAARDDDGVLPDRPFDPRIVAGLFLALSAALEELSPDVVEPILARLAEYVPKFDLLPIQRSVDAFDFDGARSKAIILAEQLGLGRE
jgi:PAS domain S-box-containing protein